MRLYSASLFDDCTLFALIPIDSSDHRRGIPGVRITFEAEDGSYTGVIVADDRGVYQIELPVGRYRVTATHEDYESYSTGTGFFVVPDSDIQHGDITMVRKGQ